MTKQERMRRREQMRKKKKRRLRRKIRRICRLIFLLLMLAVMIWVLFFVLKKTGILPEGTGKIEAPKQRTETEVKERLEELSKKEQRIQGNSG